MSNKPHRKTFAVSRFLGTTSNKNLNFCLHYFHSALVKSQRKQEEAPFTLFMFMQQTVSLIMFNKLRTVQGEDIYFYHTRQGRYGYFFPLTKETAV